MPCNNCNQTKCNGCQAEVHICNQCPPEQPCDCEVKDLSTDCILYNQDTIFCGGTEVVPKNTILTDALNKIVDWTCTRLADIQSFFVIKNVGAGAKIFKQANLIGEKEFRTLTSTNNSVSITEETDTINLSVNIPTPEDVCITSVDETVSIVNNEGCFDLSVDIPTHTNYTVTNVGQVVNETAGVCKGTTVIGDTNVFEFRSLESTNNSVTITENPNTIDFSVPVYDGSETKVTSGGNVAITGTGTTVDPYVVGGISITAGSNVTITGTGTTVDPFVVNSASVDGWLYGDIKELTCDSYYLDAYFTNTGLGVGVRSGWAICNGQNGTIDKSGRVAVQYDGVTYNMSDIGGSKDAVVVEHSHSAGTYNTGSGVPLFTSKGVQEGTDTVYSRTNSEGVSGTDKNMQPYIVTLFIQKIV